MEEDNSLTKNEISTTESTSTLKYGYVIIKHATEEMLFEDIWRYFGYEQLLEKDKIVVEFGDGTTVYDIDTVTEDVGISACEIKIFDNVLPLYFYHKFGDSRIFYNIKQPTIEEGWVTKKYRLNFTPIFNGYKNFKKGIPSTYNCIYTYNNITIFSLIKIRESREISNFLVAYNPVYLDEKEAAFIVKSILRISF